MKKFLYSIIVALTVLSGLYLAYRGYEWWQDRQKRRELFVYLQRESPVTLKMPRDATTYINLYDFNRVYNDLQGTKLATVLAHWLDTGMGENDKPNSLLGGMLEKTILNVIGSEFGIALAPSRNERLDLVAVARLRPASDFVLKLALSASKNARRSNYKGDTIYSFATKNLSYPDFYVFIRDDFAYASNSEGRLKASVEGNEDGPAFLKQLEVKPLPEEAFLFLQSKEPRVSLVASGKQDAYRIQTTSDARMEGPIPNFLNNRRTVLTVRTNATLLWKQPPASFALHTAGEEPASALLLQFPSSSEAVEYRDTIVAFYEQKGSPDSGQQFNDRGIHCYRTTIDQRSTIVCSKDSVLLLAQGRFPINHRLFKASDDSNQKPLTLRIAVQNGELAQFQDLVERQDWSKFSTTASLYFLACIQSIQGAIDESSDTISIQVQ